MNILKLNDEYINLDNVDIFAIRPYDAVDDASEAKSNTKYKVVFAKRGIQHNVKGYSYNGCDINTTTSVGEAIIFEVAGFATKEAAEEFLNNTVFSK